MKRLDSKVAIVTGASQGIGKAIAIAFGNEGANVTATARTTSAIEAVCTEIESAGSEGLAVIADVEDESALQRIVEETLARFGRIDILVNNAAIIHPRLDLVDFDPALWRQVVDVNLVSAACSHDSSYPA